jgi:translocation and assembly module TamA
MKFLRLKTALPFGALLLLTGCLGSLWPFGTPAHYSVAGLEDNADLQSYLQKIIDDRAQDKFEATDDDDADMRRESYREKMIADALVKGLQSRGYYDGAVHYEDDPAAPVTGTYHIDPGPLYTVSAVTVGPGPWPVPPGIRAGDPLDAAAVLSAQETLYKLVQKDRCYFTLDVGHEAVLDTAAHSAAIHFNVRAAREATFGPARFTGNDTVRDSYLQKLVPWKDGDCYRAEKIESLRSKLLESGLFVRADMQLPDEPGADGRVPVTVAVTEHAQRTVRAGASYYTDEGPGISLGWEHRNIFGAAEKLETALNLSMLKQELTASLKKPFFLRNDQTLSFNAALSHEDSDAYDQFGLKLGAAIDRNFTKNLSGSTGIGLNLTQIDEKNNESGDKNLYGLISLPQALKFDNRDDKLDPHKGFNAALKIAPFFDVLGESDPFFKAEFNGSTYWALADKPDLVLALRGGVGSIMGSGTFDIPSTERFFAGGGGSVRGFGYQEVGPKDDDGNPIGGRSRVTGTAELRFKITEKYGGVTFVDAGSVSESAMPDLDNLSVGAGVGVRYYTSFGPLRFDFAVPINNRDELEQTYQFYISIGQAF